MTLEAACDYELKGVPAPVRASRLRWRELAPAASDRVAAEPDRCAGRQSTRGGRHGSRVRLPPVLAAYAEEPLIGRDREIARCARRRAPRGRRAVLVLGEPGIGKTRHAAAAAAEAHAEGATGRAGALPTGGGGRLRALGAGDRRAGTRRRRGMARGAGGGGGAELAALVPELSEHATLAERAGADEVVAAEGARYRLLRGIGAALACAAGEAPLHVVLDDAHWCDPASAQALGHLLESAPAQLVLVVTARDREMGRRHPVSRVLSDLRRTGDLSELRLAGLDASGLAALVGARVGRAITPGLAARLLARTSGNPFFAGELARDLDGRGALREGEALEAAPVPDAVTDLVEERLARLDPGTERLLAAVAAIGPAAPVGLAAKAAGLGAGGGRARGAGGAVGAAGRRRRRGRADDRLPARPGPRGADRGHRRCRPRPAAPRDSPGAGGGPGAEPAELARHYGLAVELAGPEPAIAAYRAAAAAAAEGHDHEQAAAHMRSALSLLPEADLGRAGGGAAGARRAGAAQRRSGPGAPSFRGAVEAARATGDAGTLARAALGFAGGDIGFGWELGTDDPASGGAAARGPGGARRQRAAAGAADDLPARLPAGLHRRGRGAGRALVRARGGARARLGDAEARSWPVHGAHRAGSPAARNRCPTSTSPTRGLFACSSWRRNAIARTCCFASSSGPRRPTTRLGDIPECDGRSSRPPRSRSAWAAPASPGRWT